MRIALFLLASLLLLASPTLFPSIASVEADSSGLQSTSAAFVENARPDAWLLATGKPARSGLRGPFLVNDMGPASIALYEHRGPWWVYFRDKGIAGYSQKALALRDLEISLTEAARARRLRTGSRRL